MSQIIEKFQFLRFTNDFLLVLHQKENNYSITIIVKIGFDYIKV